MDECSVVLATKEFNELCSISRQVHDWLHITHDEYKTIKGMEKNERPNVYNIRKIISKSCVSLLAREVKMFLFFNVMRF